MILLIANILQHNLSLCYATRSLMFYVSIYESGSGFVLGFEMSETKDDADFVKLLLREMNQ